jgi:hypothetical protein
MKNYGNPLLSSAGAQVESFADLMENNIDQKITGG